MSIADRADDHRQTLDEPRVGVAEKVVFPLLRGVLAGLVGVVALAVWAVNVDAMISQKEPASLPLFVFRIVVCEAIPVAVVVIIFRWLGTGRGLTHLFRNIVGAFFNPRTSRRKGESEDTEALE